MTEHSPEPVDPWAPPARPAVELGKKQASRGDASTPGMAPGPPSVHDQPTIAGMPGAGGTPAGGPAGHTRPGAAPAAHPTPVPSAAQQPAPSGYQPVAQPARPASAGYGYPAPADHPVYGYPGGYPGYPGYAGHQPYAGPPQNGFGTTGLVLGILSVVGFFTSFLAIVLGVLAVIFGALGRGRAQRGEADNGGVATSGLVLGIIGIALAVLVIVLMFSSLRDLGPLEDDGPPSRGRDSISQVYQRA
ncbi:DUF4190 domain-containing protein [Streptomyces sp. NPDC090022]|uniref:DUF4190 domain-containing protein n=1 Tax=Streptomyces sp. NPDC090022 TaxID=3365920 RepID=UPI0038185984